MKNEIALNTEEHRQNLQCKTFPLGSFNKYKYVVVCSYYKGKYMLSRHSRRSTWETQGGHIESGENPIDAAIRELYEESGVTDAEIIPVCDYKSWGDAGNSNGVVFVAVINTIGEIPESEMAEVKLFDKLPNNLTYPLVIPVMFKETNKVVRSLLYEKMKWVLIES